MKVKKSLKVPKPPSTQKMWVAVGVALFLLIFFVVIYSGYKAGTGKAVEIKPGQPVPSYVNLVTQDSLIFTSSYLSTLSVGTPVNVDLNTNPISPESASPFKFTITKQDESLYSINVKSESPPLGQPPDSFDIVDINEPDTLNFYLTTTDLIPDIQVISQDGQIIVRNLHFIPGTLSKIEFNTLTGGPYPFIIRVPPGAQVLGKINVSSSSFPTLYSNPGLLTNKVENRIQNYTSADFSFVPPTNRVYTITSVVGQQSTYAHYLFAVGNVTFNQNGLKVVLTEPRGNKANLTVTLSSTPNLQPFAPPCTLTDDSVQSVFGTLNNSRVYTYDPVRKTTMLWHQNTSIPDDFEDFELGGGYFVYNPTSAVFEKNVSCTVDEVISMKNSPVSARINSRQWQNILVPGWNLIALPGVVPQRVTDFTSDTQFTLFDCEPGDLDCEPLGIATTLTSGKPYWVFTDHAIQLQYGIK